MVVLFKFFGYHPLKNLAPVLGIGPERVVFFYDRNLFNHIDIYSVYDTCCKYIPHLSYEVWTADYANLHSIEKKLAECLENHQGDEICIDMTGGNELTAVCGAGFAWRNKLDAYYMDINSHIVFDITDGVSSYRPFRLELNDIITAGGGKLLDYTDEEYLEKESVKLNYMAQVILKQVPVWSKTCMYFQRSGKIKKISDDLYFKGKLEGGKDSRHTVPDQALMYEFQKMHFIRGLYFTKNQVSFTARDKKALEYLVYFGVWLELFTYYAMLEIEELHDVKTGVKIDWNRHDQVEIVGNEIDVTAMYHGVPVIVSCKLSENGTNAETLNELFSVSSRICVESAVPILVTYSEIKAKKMGIYMKARQMGIEVMDKTDIMSGQFSRRLRRAIMKNHKKD